jgi:hypothetical protein
MKSIAKKKKKKFEQKFFSMTFNLRSKSQALFILKIFFLFTQAVTVIIINVTNLNVEEIDTLFSEVSDQVMILLNAEASFFKSFIYMFFKSIISLISVAFAESEIISSVSALNDHMKK